MSVADEIKGRLDIVDYIQRYVPLKRAGRSFKAPCPFHNEKTPSFVVNPDRQSWRCFGSCAEGGDVIKFAQKLHGWSFTEALQELGKLTGVEVRPRTPEQVTQDDRMDVLRGLMHTAMDAYHNALLDLQSDDAAAVRHYVYEKRGLTLDTISQFKIGYAPPGWTHMLDHLKTLGYSDDQALEVGLAIKNEDSGRIYDRFRNRLMIPIRDERGRVTGFGARALAAEDNPKYLNSPQTPLFDKSRTLFGLDAAKQVIRDTETAVIVEGYMDAIQAHQAGFKNVVAQMGTAMTETQIRLLTRSAKKIILALDSDAAGQNATRRSLETARATLAEDFSGRLSVDIRVLQIPGAKDPDDLIRETPDRWRELVEQALPIADYVIEMETRHLPPNATVQEREAIARSLLPLLLASEDQLYTRDNLQKLALRLRIREQDLLAWGNEQEKIERAKAPRKPAAPPPAAAPPMPPADLEPLPPPPDWDSDAEWSAPVVTPAAPRKAADIRESGLELQCLRLVVREPMAYYAVNRKLRELAKDNRDLMEDALADWNADDFNHSDLRALMAEFLTALAQDELEPLDYLRLRADYALQISLDVILADDLMGMRNRVRESHVADMQQVWDRNRRTVEAVNAQEQLIEKALRLRARRLQREREDLVFLQMDALNQNDDDLLMRCTRNVKMLNQAQQLLDAELRQFASRLRD